LTVAGVPRALDLIEKFHGGDVRLGARLLALGENRVVVGDREV
jgi:hypothetical protein